MTHSRSAPLALILLLWALLQPAGAQTPEAPAKKFIVYAQFQEQTRVELSSGAVWEMDKGDCFPVYMFRENQTKVVLQLASLTFTVPASSVRILKDSEKEIGLASYRRNLVDYLNGHTEEWKKQAAKQKNGEAIPAKSK